MNDILGQILSNPLVGAIGLALAIGAIALWLATAWWAYGDALRRTESSVAAFGAAGWIILSTPVFLPSRCWRTATPGRRSPQRTPGPSGSPSPSAGPAKA